MIIQDMSKKIKFLLMDLEDANQTIKSLKTQK